MKEPKTIKKRFFHRPTFRSDHFDTLFLFIKKITKKNTTIQEEAFDDANISPAVLNKAKQKNKFAFSKRQLDIIVLVKQGKTNKQIGEILFISENTVKYHLKLIYSTLKIENRVELAYIKL